MLIIYVTSHFNRLIYQIKRHKILITRANQLNMKRTESDYYSHPKEYLEENMDIQPCHS